MPRPGPTSTAGERTLYEELCPSNEWERPLTIHITVTVITHVIIVEIRNVVWKERRRGSGVSINVGRSWGREGASWGRGREGRRKRDGEGGVYGKKINGYGWRRRRLDWKKNKRVWKEKAEARLEEKRPLEKKERDSVSQRLWTDGIYWWEPTCWPNTWRGTRLRSLIGLMGRDGAPTWAIYWKGGERWGTDGGLRLTYFESADRSHRLAYWLDSYGFYDCIWLEERRLLGIL